MKAKRFILFIFIIVIGSLKSYPQYFIRGKVSNQQNEALNGVIVLTDNKQEGVRTNQQGLYEIEADSISKFLIFSFPGMNLLELPIKENIVINAKLEEIPDHIVQQHPMITISSVIQQKTHQSESMGYLKNGLSGIMIAPDPIAYNTENYAFIRENTFHPTIDEPLSTFSIDVDKASYTNIRRFINNGQLPPKDAVRIEEMINYFEYNYPQPNGDEVVSMSTAYTVCPWNDKHQLVFIGLQGKKISANQLPQANLVFLIDVSGSMQSVNKLPLVKSSLKMLVENLRDNDRIALVTYAGAAQIILNSTPASNKKTIHDAIDGLWAGGSTAGADGLKMAYRVASTHFNGEGNNRIIMATDGDFNVGQSNDAEMKRLVIEQGRHNISLTVLGYGMGNLKDNRLEQMAQSGNGNYAYIDNSQEAYRTLISEFGGTLFTIAKDVKIQIEFNPALVKAYRQLGYENRKLDKQDFNDKNLDASDLGAGQQVTVIYEIIPTISDEQIPEVTPLRYQHNSIKQQHQNELATIRMRYHDVASGNDQIKQHIVNNELKSFDDTFEAFKFSASVAQFGMLLRDSPFKGNATVFSTEKLARSTLYAEREGYRDEFIRLVKTAASLGLNQKQENRY
jgi:Ca-activated chloride channel homolog